MNQAPKDQKLPCTKDPFSMVLTQPNRITTTLIIFGLSAKASQTTKPSFLNTRGPFPQWKTANPSTEQNKKSSLLLLMAAAARGSISKMKICLVMIRKGKNKMG